jgi:dienelactone hydrolase
MTTAATDENLRAAVATWRSRFVANGVHAHEVDDLLARLERWQDWCAAWHGRGRVYAQRARVADRQGHRITGRDAWRQASLLAHFAKYLFLHDRPAYEAARRDSVAWYRRAAARFSPRATPVAIPLGPARLPGYLRVPAAGAPLALLIPGLDSVKEELHAYSDDLTARGIATLALDAPGQGESEDLLPLEPAFERVVAAVLDTLPAFRGVDGRRVALVGVSVGGYFALRGSIVGGPVRAAAALGGFARYREEWPVQPALSRRAFTVRTWSRDECEATDKARAFDLVPVLDQIRVPVLVLEGGRDRHRQNPNSLSHVAAGRFERLYYPEGGHVCNNLSALYRPRVADWIADRLAAP